MAWNHVPFEKWLNLREDAAVAQQPAAMTPQLQQLKDRVRQSFRMRNVKSGDLDPYIKANRTRNDYNYNWAGDENHIFGTDKQMSGRTTSGSAETQDLTHSTVQRMEKMKGMKKR